MPTEADILLEFEQYQRTDYRDNHALAEIYEVFGTDENVFNGNRGFTIQTRSGYYETEIGRAKQQNIELFAQTLIKTGNFEYSRASASLGNALAKWYVDFLNNTAIERGLPIIFKRAKRISSGAARLTEKQVSYIKYLVNKYSTYQVAAMYNVSQATIQQIKNNDTWKYVPAALKSQKEILKYSNTRYLGKDLPKIDPISNEQLMIRLESNRWGIGKSICPFCKHPFAYYNAKRKQYNCANWRCKSKFSLYSRTLYENTKVQLSAWYAVEKLLEIPEISYSDIARVAGITQASASKMIKKIKLHPFKSLILTDFHQPINM